LPEYPARHRRRPDVSLGRGKLLRPALAIALVGGEAALLVPHFSGETFQLRHLHWGWVALAIWCEIGSMILFARLRRRLLRAGGLDVSLGRMGALTAASTAIQFTFPAGIAVSAGYLYRQLRKLGGSPALVAWTLATGSVVSALAFSVIAMAGTVLDGDSSLAGVVGASGLSLGLVLVLVAGLGMLTRHPQPVQRWVRAACRRLPLVRERADAVERATAQLATITPRWRDWSLVFWFALANWVADLACFVLCCYAVGVDRLTVGAAVLAYVAGLATSTITLLPAGVGSVDAGLLIGLTQAGVAAPVAAVGVLTYRIVAYGLVAAVGWVVWAALRRRPAPA
jgi:uncharacterized protein (TIRG00374 family)